MSEVVLFIHFWKFFLHGRVPVVLDGVVGAAGEVFGDLSPPVAERLVGQEEDPLLVLAPVLLLDVRIQMIVPPLSALLADTTFLNTSLPGRFSEIVVHF